MSVRLGRAEMIFAVMPSLVLASRPNGNLEPHFSRNTDGDQLRSADWSKFGLKGSIATEEACDAAGGRFWRSIFGWMVHVYPYEDSLDKAFAMHHHN